MSFLTDLRRALRSLRRTGGFALTIIVPLGLAVALCTTAFVVVRAYLLRDLPYPEAERLYSVRYGAPGEDMPRNMESLEWHVLSDVIEHPIAWDLDVFYLLGGDHAESVPGAWVTPGFVQALGIRPAIGRGFDADAFATGAGNVALISHRLWSTRFGADRDVLGRSFTAYVSDRPQEAEQFTVIGVLPPDFWHINPYTEVLAPLRAETFPYMVRLQPDVSPQHAASRITSLVRAGAGDVRPDWRAELVSTHAAYVASVRPMLRAVAAAAGLVLLVACANVAGLMVLRAMRRRGELAVRAVLGAGPGAIIRIVFAEALILGVAASLLALFVSDLALGLVGTLVQQQIGRAVPRGTPAFALDAVTCGFTAGLGVFAAALCTLVSLPGTLRPAVLAAVQADSRTSTESRRNRRIRTGIIAVEIAVSLALLAGSTLMVRSVVRLMNSDLGFTAERVLQGSIVLRQNRYPDAAARQEVFERMLSRLAAIPGVDSVGLTTVWPVQSPRVYSVADAEPRMSSSTRAALHVVGGEYFSTLEIPIAGGRPFAPTDRIGAEPVAIVSATLARRLWPGGDALGRRISVAQEQNDDELMAAPRLVVGVAADVRQGQSDDDLGDVYVPLLQTPGRFAFVMLKTAGDPSGWIPPFRAAFREVDPEIAVDRVRPLQAIVDQLVALPRFLATLLTSFASAAAVLALLGVYGLIAYTVRQRQREIAVRIAIGANPARLTRHFVRQGAMTLTIGLVFGMVGALAVGRLIEHQLFGVTAWDPIALGTAAAIFAAAGLVAIWLPARRAATTDPAIALKVE